MTKEGKKWETEFPTKCEPHTHKIFYEFFFESQQIQNTTFALHPHTRTNMMNTQIHNRYCSVYKSTGVWRTHVLPKRNAECKRNERNMNANRIHRRPRMKLHNTHVLIRSGVPALLLYDCARCIWSNRQIPHVCCCFLLLLLLLLLPMRFFHSLLFTANSLCFFRNVTSIRSIKIAFKWFVYETRINIQVDCTEQHWCQLSGPLPIICTLKSDFWILVRVAWIFFIVVGLFLISQMN